MGNDINWLINILYQGQLLKVAIKFADGILTHDKMEYYMEPDSKEAIHSKLPPHLKNLGPIVDIWPLFDVYIVHKVHKEE